MVGHQVYLDRMKLAFIDSSLSSQPHMWRTHDSLDTHLGSVRLAGRRLEAHAAKEGAKAQPGAGSQPVAVPHVQLRLRAVRRHQIGLQRRAQGLGFRQAGF